MLKLWKQSYRFRLLSLISVFILFFVISSTILNFVFHDKTINQNESYVVGKNIDPGRYLFKQVGKINKNKLYIKTKIDQRSNLVGLDKNFLKEFDINVNKKVSKINIDYNSNKVSKFIEKNPKINLYNQVKQLSFKQENVISLVSSYNVGLKDENVIDNIELAKGDVVHSTSNISLYNRYAPIHLFWDNVINSTIWVTFQAGVVVPLSMFIINYLFYLTKYGFTKYMRRNKLVQLILSSTLGAMPGDATTLVLFPFYFSKIITWGSLVALSVAGIGDSGFILMSNHFNIFGTNGSNYPNMFITVMIIKIVIAIVVGFVLIKFNVDPKIPTDADKKLNGKTKESKILKQQTGIINPGEFNVEDMEELELNMDSDEKVKLEHISYLEGSEVDELLHHNKSSLAYKPNKILLWLKNYFLWVLFWVVEIVKYVIFFAQGADIADESNNPMLRLVGLITAVIVIGYWFIISLDKNDEVAEVESSKASFKQTIIHSTEASVKIMFRVIVIMSIYKIIVFGLIGNSNVEAFFGSFQSWWILTLLGVGVGFIPGCQLQIAFQTVAISLGWPLPAVLANALSQIGDSAFSFITVSKKAWFQLETYNALIALVVSLAIGYIMFGHF